MPKVVKTKLQGQDVWKVVSGVGVAEDYYAWDGISMQLRLGEPLKDPHAWLYGATGEAISPSVPTIASPEPAPITYESGLPTGINLATGSKVIDGKNYYNTTDNPVFDLGSMGAYGSPNRLVVKNSVIRSKGSAFSGYRGRLRLENVVIIIDPPTVKGKAAARPIVMQEFADMEMENVTIIGGAGNYFSGLNNKFYGNAANGDGFKALGVRYTNPDGRRSDGAGGYIKSNWANGHANNADRIANNGEIGWDIANFAQFNGANGMLLNVRWVETLCELGKSRTEDTISLYGGSGGSAEIPGLFEDCLFDSSGGYDWNYQKGVSTTYDASNQVTLNATSYQKVADTRSSGTAVIIGDGTRALYEDNSCYVTLRRVVGIGARPLIGNDYAHHITYDECETYLMPAHWTGVPYTGYHDGFFQIRPKTATAAYTVNGVTTQRLIYGAITFTNNLYGTPTTASPEPYELSGTQMQDGGTQANNFKVKSPADGGAQIIRNFRARAAQAGVRIGASISHPIGTIADAFEQR